jgi:hypothetical protein
MKIVGGYANADLANRRHRNRRRSGEQVREQYLPVLRAQVLSGSYYPFEERRPRFTKRHGLRNIGRYLVIGAIGFSMTGLSPVNVSVTQKDLMLRQDDLDPVSGRNNGSFMTK